ncbi:MAG: hypothetical protein K5928_03630, partial [Prevotella sp.]|nr:hypothetical protein [Prevotella sp.]
MSFILCQTRYSTIIHQRLISASEIIRQVVYLTSSFTVMSYLLLKVIDYRLPVGMTLLKTGVLMFFTLLLTRYIERWIIKRFRSSGRNTRTVTLIGK